MKRPFVVALIIGLIVAGVIAVLQVTEVLARIEIPVRDFIAQHNALNRSLGETWQYALMSILAVGVAWMTLTTSRRGRLGWLVLGFTLSAAVPAAFGLVGESGEDPTNAIAAVTTIGYTGFIWSPPLLGWVAQSFSLRAAMGVIVIATLGIIGGGLLAPHDPRG